MARSGQRDNECAEKADSYEYHLSPSSNYPALAEFVTIQHLATIPFGFLLLWFRQSNVPLFGQKVDLVWGTPVECIIWTLVLVDLARRDILSSLKRR
ncbi:hypothetical protein DM02DRAFT_612481 [Periconia macrospinosa]|uniref:Uncharacterized protein n=1 Tax=Periconia macrospinosa TaxID=97972 RepID=A0A2V1E1U2_9PLEO|nr:hypothetical protein DM02DRAFT_612481 [Periconia macrospinosa]